MGVRVGEVAERQPELVYDARLSLWCIEEQARGEVVHVSPRSAGGVVARAEEAARAGGVVCCYFPGPYQTPNQKKSASEMKQAVTV